MFILPTKWNFIAKSFEALSSILDRMYNDIYTEVLDIRTIIWIEVTSFSNSWVNYGGGFPNAAYCKSASGIVSLKGLIKSGTVTSAAFTLPVGFRPLEQNNFIVDSNGALGILVVSSNGEVNPNSGNNGYFWLSGITFYAG